MSKDKRQDDTKIEQENQSLENKQSEKDEDNYCLKNLNQRLFDQIKKLRDNKMENLE